MQICAAGALASAVVYCLYRRSCRRLPPPAVRPPSAVRRRVEELWLISAVDLLQDLRSGRVTPEMLIDAAVQRIKATDSQVHAIATLCEERARERAAAFASAGGAPGPLFGLPVLVKDNQPVAGLRCTAGATLFADRIAKKSHPIVAAIEAAGGIVLGLTNMPEHAAGSHTFNPVFGTTFNPFDLTRTAGGSTGGGAAALACGSAWLATGNDLGGSLRNPAAFNNVVGLRPTPGRCAMPAPPATAWRGRWSIGLHSVQGPLGRTVEDVALLLDALAPRAYPIEPDVTAVDVTAVGVTADDVTADAATDAAGESAGFTPLPAEFTPAELIPPAANWEADACPELLHPPPRGFLHHVRYCALSDAPRSVAFSVDLGGLLRGVEAEVLETALVAFLRASDDGLGLPLMASLIPCRWRQRCGVLQRFSRTLRTARRSPRRASRGSLTPPPPSAHCAPSVFKKGLPAGRRRRMRFWRRMGQARSPRFFGSSS